jgi:hypothetical protein
VLLAQLETKDRRVTLEVLDQAALQDLLGRLDRLDLEEMLDFLAVQALQVLQVLLGYLVPPVRKDSKVLQVQEVALDRQVMQGSKVHWVRRDHLERLEQQEVQEHLDFPVLLDRQVQLDHWDQQGRRGQEAMLDLLEMQAHLVLAASLDQGVTQAQPALREPLEIREHKDSLD